MYFNYVLVHRYNKQAIFEIHMLLGQTWGKVLKEYGLKEVGAGHLFIVIDDPYIQGQGWFHIF